MISYLRAEKPIETKLRSRAFTSCHAPSTMSLMVPGSSTAAISAVNGMPAAFGFANVTWPTAWREL